MNFLINFRFTSNIIISYFLIMICSLSSYGEDAPENFTLLKLDSLNNYYKNIYQKKNSPLEIKADSGLSVSVNNEIKDGLILIKNSSILLSREFSFANTMATYAKNMSIYEGDAEANKVIKLCSKAENAYNVISVIIGTVGGATSLGLLFYKKDLPKESFIGLNLASFIPQLLKLRSTKIHNKETIETALKYAQEKASRFSINAYLSIELSSISLSLKDIVSKSLSVYTKTESVKNMDQLKSISKEYFSLIDAVDQYYTTDIFVLNNKISSEIMKNIFSDKTKEELYSLCKSLTSTRDIWFTSKYIYDDNREIIAHLLGE